MPHGILIAAQAETGLQWGINPKTTAVLLLIIALKSAVASLIGFILISECPNLVLNYGSDVLQRVML